MNKIAMQALLVLFLASPVHAADRQAIPEVVSTLDAESRARLGVGLYALSLITRVTPYSSFPKDVLARNGDLARFQELQSAGYLAISEERGLPNGAEPDSIFITIKLSPEGQQLQAAMGCGP